MGLATSLRVGSGYAPYSLGKWCGLVLLYIRIRIFRILYGLGLFFMFNNVRFSLIIYSCGLLVIFGYTYYIWQ